MPVIKIHLEDAESDAVARLADLLQLAPEDVAYAALNRLMLVGREKPIQDEIRATRNWRANNLPLWSDSAYSVHNYEGFPPSEPEKSKYSV
jgi:hypothetical protein